MGPLLDTDALAPRTLAARALLDQLYKALVCVLHDTQECRSMIQQLLCFYFRIDATDFILNTVLDYTPDIEKKILAAISRLKKHEPLQYILGSAYFAGNYFTVTPDVLIPRPETEEWVTFLTNHVTPPTSILDIGTGSGCIAITLKQHFPQARVDAVDISQNALAIAHYNAQKLALQVNFKAIDILTESLPSTHWSLIVSNPPYVCMQEKKEMAPNVLNYEPHAALFVEDDDPLLFYRRIIYLAQHHLTTNGLLCLEINEALGKKIVDLLKHAHFKAITLYRDIHEKERWITAMHCKS